MTKFVLALSLLAALFLLGACSDPTPTPAVPPTATVPPGPTNTLTVTPTFTPSPTSTTIPTATPSPTATSTQGAVRTPVGGAAGPELEGALTAMERVGSYRYDLTIAVGPAEATYVLTGTGEFQAPNSYHTTYYSLDFPTEETTIGDQRYVRINNGSWQMSDLPIYKYPLGAPPSLSALTGLLTYALDASLIDTEDLNGEAARHFRFLLQPTVLPGVQGPYQGLAGGDLWVGAQSHRFLRLQMVADPASSPELNATTISIDFSDYNAPITIKPPL